MTMLYNIHFVDFYSSIKRHEYAPHRYALHTRASCGILCSNIYNEYQSAPDSLNQFLYIPFVDSVIA